MRSPLLSWLDGRTCSAVRCSSLLLEAEWRDKCRGAGWTSPNVRTRIRSVRWRGNSLAVITTHLSTAPSAQDWPDGDRSNRDGHRKSIPVVAEDSPLAGTCTVASQRRVAEGSSRRQGRRDGYLLWLAPTQRPLPPARPITGRLPPHLHPQPELAPRRARACVNSPSFCKSHHLLLSCCIFTVRNFNTASLGESSTLAHPLRFFRFVFDKLVTAAVACFWARVAFCCFISLRSTSLHLA